MLKEERQRLILDRMKTHGRVVAAELSQQLGVSEDTIRRDLRELDASGLIQRVHGGGLPHSPASASFEERLRQSPQAKEAIARAATGLLHNGQVVLLDGGTTTLQLARLLPASLRITAVTNSPLIAAELAAHEHIEVIVLGGRMYKSSQVTTGAAVVEQLSSMRVDLFFLGVCSLHPQVGISVPDLEECMVKRAMLDCAAESVALASAEKLGTASTHIVGPIQRIQHLITDETVPDAVLDEYKEKGLLVQQAH